MKDRREFILALAATGPAMLLLFGCSEEQGDGIAKKDGTKGPQELDPTGPSIEDLANGYTPDINKLLDASFAPLDAYIDEVALTGVDGFVSEFVGFIDTPSVGWAMLKDWIEWGGDGERFERKIRQAMQKHMGFPDQFGEALEQCDDAFWRYQEQLESAFRDEAYRLLHGKGIRVKHQDVAGLDIEAQREALAEVLKDDAACETAVSVVELTSISIAASKVLAQGLKRAFCRAASRAVTKAAKKGSRGPWGWMLALAELVWTFVTREAILEEIQGHIEDVRDDAKAEMGIMLALYTGELQGRRAALLEQLVEGSGK